MIILFKMEDSEVNQMLDSLGSYASRRAPAIINCNGSDREIGRVFAEYKDNFIIIDGENKKEHEYLIPKSRVDRFGENQVYFNVAESILKEFEI
jgi:hypothetical protein